MVRFCLLGVISTPKRSARLSSIIMMTIYITHAYLTKKETKSDRALKKETKILFRLERLIARFCTKKT